MLTMSTTILALLAIGLAAVRRRLARARRDRRIASRLVRTLHAEARTGALLFRRAGPLARREALFAGRRSAA